jgi:RNA recognition motif-containing protein
MPSKLYVGNLAYPVSNSDLEALFSQAGKVQSVAVIMDKLSGQSKGFGFVEMATAEEASKAIQQFNDTELKGRNIKVSEAKPRENSFGGGNRGGSYGGERTQPLVESGLGAASAPSRVLAFGDDVPVGQGRVPINGKPAAYVCRNRARDAQVTTAEALRERCSM